MDKFTVAANLASFLQDNKGSVMGVFKGKMLAKQQRELFGTFVGKGTIEIDGTQETIRHWVKVCFGLDYDVTFSKKWDEM